MIKIFFDNELELKGFPTLVVSVSACKWRHLNADVNLYKSWCHADVMWSCTMAIISYLRSHMKTEFERGSYTGFDSDKMRSYV